MAFLSYPLKSYILDNLGLISLTPLEFKFSSKVIKSATKNLLE